jgi:hypothetical protein
MEATVQGKTISIDEQLSPSGNERRKIIIPKDYSVGPVFAAIKQPEGKTREVTVMGRRYQIGGFHPLRPDLKPGELPPALDVRHARALFALLSFRNPEEDIPDIHFSFNEFCHRYAHSNGGRYPCPREKKRRWRLFNKSQKSILHQLDGVNTLSGVFRIRMVPTSDDKDWKFLCWVERHFERAQRDPRNSKLMTTFLANGWSQRELDFRLANAEPLTDYDLQTLKTAEIDVQKDRRFLELAKALLGRARFETVVGECKADVLEGRKATKSPTARLIWRLTGALPKKPPLLPNHLSLEDGSQLREILARRNESRPGQETVN